MTMNLPTLTGSEKQVAWATEIRQFGLDRVRLGFAAATEARPEVGAVLGVWLDRIEAQTDAGWWIENRDFFAIAHEPRMAMKAHALGREIMSDIVASVAR